MNFNNAFGISFFIEISDKMFIKGKDNGDLSIYTIDSVLTVKTNSQHSKKIDKITSLRYISPSFISISEDKICVNYMNQESDFLCQNLTAKITDVIHLDPEFLLTTHTNGLINIWIFEE